jgi:serine/threonine protein kinase/Flp pilus assembly protein TadD
MNPSASISARPPQPRAAVLEDLVEELTNRIQAGEAVDADALAARYPEHAGAIHDLLPALQVLAGMSAATGEPGASATGDEPARTLGDFRLIREVGRGGMGIVYEAEQVSLGRRVALKVLPFAATMDPRHLQRFHNEARAAAGLHHTNIVPVHGVGNERGVHYYAMQFIEGSTLADLIAEQRRGLPSQVPTVPLAEAAASATTVPPAAQATSSAPRDRAYFRRAAEWGIQAAEALDYAHTLGVVHRDIKPANLMVDMAGRVWVTDFGLAQVQSDTRITMTGDLVGTLRYMSPEQALAKRVVVDHRTDVYSLGATLYELLTLEPAFTGADRQELLRQIAFEEPTPLRRLNRRVPAELETIVLKALEKNPADRYATAKELAEDLRHWLEDRPIRARRPSLVARGRKWVRRHGPAVRATTALLVLALLLCAGLAAWWFQKRTWAQAQAQAALQEAAQYQQDERWPEALSAARQAQGLLAGFWADPALRRQADELARDLEMVGRLQEARLELMADKEGHLEWEAGDAAYASAFAAYGLDIDGLNPQVVAEQIRSRPIHRQLVAALDDWANDRKSLKAEGWAQRLAAARAADPDPRRNRLRDALEANDPKALEEAAATDQAADWPSETLVLLGSLASGTASGERVAALLARAQQRQPGDFWINQTLALLFQELRPPRREEAIRFFSIAVALRPQSPGARNNLGNALGDKGQLDAAIAEYREALRLKPDLAVAHNNLGKALGDKGQLDAAIAEYREALRLKPDLAEAHNNLGVALRDKGELDAAIAEYHEAIRLKPDYAMAHYNLGNSLSDKGQLDAAIAEYHEAIRLKPDFAQAHNNLGNRLSDKGQLGAAIGEYREALRLKPDYAMAHYNLGNSLSDKGQLDAAIAEYHEAIRLKPDFAQAHGNLGNALYNKGQLDDAIAEYREAMRLEKLRSSPDGVAQILCNLGQALAHKGLLDEAIAQYREAIRHKPDLAEAHCKLGAALCDLKHDYDGAIDEFRTAIRLKPDDAIAGKNLRQAERLLELDRKLPAILSGKQQPADVAQRIALAELCQRPWKRRYLAALRFYEAAFAVEPKLTGDQPSEARYNAACAAALAGCGEGEDAKSLDDKERARLRRRALDWLRADLAAWQKLLDKEPDKTRAAAAQQLAHWLEDKDFAGVRRPEALAKLPEAERRDWQRLWDEVKAVGQRALSGAQSELLPPPNVSDAAPGMSLNLIDRPARVAGDEALVLAIDKQVQTFENDRANERRVAFRFHQRVKCTLPSQDIDLRSASLPSLGFAAVRVTDIDRVPQGQPEPLDHGLRKNEHGRPRIDQAADSFAAHLVGRQQALASPVQIAVVDNLEFDAESTHAVGSLGTHDGPPQPRGKGGKCIIRS